VRFGTFAPAYLWYGIEVPAPVKSPARHTVTAALPYANGPLHIGHIAGAYLPADIYVRNLRQRGKEVLFICGSDEHGAAITIRAMSSRHPICTLVCPIHAAEPSCQTSFTPNSH
jgi:methionyl-tRNA synthetase